MSIRNESDIYPTEVGGIFLGGFLPWTLDLLATGAVPSGSVELEVLAVTRLRVAPEVAGVEEAG